MLTISLIHRLIQSAKLVLDLHLHLILRKIVSRNFTSQIDHHHIECSEVSVEIPCCLDQNLPVAQVLGHVVLVQLHADLLELAVETCHQLLEVVAISHFVS